MLLDRLNWRYATKKMDPAKAVAEDKVTRILEAARLAPTSSGLQPFEILVVTDPAIRAQIRSVAWDQAQVTEGSHLLVFAAWDNYTAERIDGVVTEMTEARGGASEAILAYYDRLKSMYLPRPADVNYEHAARQAYIAFGLAIAQAAFEEVDTTPMEGFDADKVDEILGLRGQGLRAVTLLPLGYRDASADWLVNLPKVRRAADKLIRRVA